MWKFDENGLMDNFPKLIINVFYGFQGRTLDASLSFKNGKSMLFSGECLFDGVFNRADQRNDF